MYKPRGWGAFDSLARKVAAVPKDKVDDAIAKAKKRRLQVFNRQTSPHRRIVAAKPSGRVD